MPSLLSIFTMLHVAISLAAIASGFIVIIGFYRSKMLSNWTAFFLTTTVLTSLTGFGFPVDRIMPGHVFGILSLIALSLAIYARYLRHLAGQWRVLFIATTIFSQYLNVFVLIVQSFLKIPSLKALAPTQSEIPFLLAQGLALIAFIVAGVFAAIRFQPRNASLEASAITLD